MGCQYAKQGNTGQLKCIRDNPKVMSNLFCLKISFGANHYSGGRLVSGPSPGGFTGPASPAATTLHHHFKSQKSEHPLLSSGIFAAIVEIRGSRKPKNYVTLRLGLHFCLLKSRLQAPPPPSKGSNLLNIY